MVEKQSEETGPEKTDRPAALLTDRHRRYLKGESGIEPKSQTERRARARIRSRLRNTILDFVLLFRHMEQRDIDLVFGPDRNPDNDDVLRTGLQHLFGFFYGATRAFHPSFKGLVQIGVTRGARRYFGRDDRAELTIERRGRVTIDAINARVEAGEIDALTDEERLWVLETYAEAGELPDVREAFEQTSDGEMVAEVRSEMDAIDESEED